MFLNSDNSYGFQNFGAMKKSQFQGLDLICVNTFKAPIEKFNSNMDLQAWAKKFVTKDTFTPNLEGRTQFSTDARKTVFDKWNEYLEKAENITTAGAAVIMKSLFGDLKANTDVVPPVVNDKVVKKTITLLEGKQSANFKKDYTADLQKALLKKGESLEKGWIKIDSQANDPKHFSENVERLKTFSSGSWCTKNLKAEEYLKNGNFYIMYDNGKPVAGIRTDAGRILEIQGVKNNGEIPCNYVTEIADFCTKEGLDRCMVEGYFDYAYEKAYTIDNYKKIWNSLIENKDGQGILNKFCMYIEPDKEGTMTLNKLKRFENDVRLADLGINETEVFKDVVKIMDDADFVQSNATSLPKLEVVYGDLDLRNSSIRELKALKEVFGNVDLRGSQLSPEDFKNVKIHGEIKVREPIHH